MSDFKDVRIIGRVVGCSGVKTFVKDGQTITYGNVSVRDSKGVMLELKCDPSVDFSVYLDKEVELQVELRKGSSVRVVAVVPDTATSANPPTYREVIVKFNNHQYDTPGQGVDYAA